MIRALRTRGRGVDRLRHAHRAHHSSPSRPARCGRWRCRPTAPGSSPSTRPTTGSRSSPSTRGGLTPRRLGAGRPRAGRGRGAHRTPRSGSSTTSPTASASSTSARRPPRVVAHAARRRRAARHRLRRPGRQPRLHHHRAPRPERARSMPPAAPRRASAAPTSGCSTRPTSATTLGGTPLTILDALRRHAARARGRAPTAAPSTPRSSTPATRRRRVTEGVVCDGGAGARAVQRRRHRPCPGGLPAPNTNVQGIAAARGRPDRQVRPRRPAQWHDELGRNWNNGGALRAARPRRLRDRRRRAAHAGRRPPASPHVGTILFNMVVNPVSGQGLRQQHRGAERGALRRPRHLRRHAPCAATCTRRASPCSTARPCCRAT